MNISLTDIRLRPIALLGLAIAVVSGSCTREPPAPTVSYFRAHPDELNEAMKGCRDDPGGAGRTALCVNAAEAARLRDIGSLRDLPPMGLPGADSADKHTTPSPNDLPGSERDAATRERREP